MENIIKALDQFTETYTDPKNSRIKEIIFDVRTEMWTIKYRKKFNFPDNVFETAEDMVKSLHVDQYQNEERGD